LTNDIQQPRRKLPVVVQE